VTNNKSLLINARKTKQFVKEGNVDGAEATYIGQVDMIVQEEKRLRLNDVLYVPGFIPNVIRLSKIVSNGATVKLHDGFVKFRTGENEMKLQKANKESMWTITSMTMHHDEAFIIDKKEEKKKPKPTMHVMEAHEKLGHPNEKTTRLTMESFGWKTTGEMEPCDACLRFNAKSKAVSHNPTATRVELPGERLLMDTTGPYKMSAGGTKYDIHVVDQTSEMGWEAHVAQRSAVPEIFNRHCKLLKGKGMSVKQLRCDNAGEHQTKLKRVCERNGIDMEYTLPCTPQMNGVVERQIASTNRSTLTMLHRGKFNDKSTLRLRVEAQSLHLTNCEICM
jgi:hypothetical protein